MRRLILLALLLAFPVLAAPPYDVRATVVAPPDGGAVSSYELFLNGTSLGAVVVGQNTFDDVITANGTYTFVVRAINQFGETDSDPFVLAALPPGKATLQLQVLTE